MPINSECINVARKGQLGKGGEKQDTVELFVFVWTDSQQCHSLLASMFALLCLGTFVWRQHQNKHGRDTDSNKHKHTHKHNW